MAESNLRYCVGSPEGACFLYEPVRQLTAHPEFHKLARKLQKKALGAALQRAKRGEAILHCSTLTSRRGRRQESCYVDRHKQPTDLTLALVGLGTVALVSYVRG